MVGQRDEGAAAELGGKGPYDSANAPTDDGIQRLDLGSLLLPALPDLELRMQGSEDGQIAAVIVANADSGLQLGVFAAPRTEEIWDEVRTDIAESVTADGGRVEESPGEFGMELRARVSTPEGPSDLRFIGIDGPRWFVRGLFQGKAAVDDVAAEQLAAVLRHLVVVRDNEPRPVREPLPLRLPKEFAEEAARQQQAAAEAGQAGPNGAGPQSDAGGAHRRRPSPGPRDEV